MDMKLPEEGSLDAGLYKHTLKLWQEAADQAGCDTSGFDPEASLQDQIIWARRKVFEIGTCYARFSTKMQQSTEDQLRVCLEHAARNNIFCPPEFICVDEGRSGRRSRRKGLQRLELLLERDLVDTLLIFKLSRLHRQAYGAYQFIQQQVAERGKRAISVTQGIDTANLKTWKLMFQVHGMVDDLMIEATADHVRAAHIGLHLLGFSTGAIPVGYLPKEVPDAPRTNRGLVRTVPAIDPEGAKMIQEHFQFIADGMPISKGHKKWVDDGGPFDPRSTTGRMSYPAYRRMLSRVAYLGLVEYGRNRNIFSTKLDYSKQIEQPEEEVKIYQSEELRIVDDELFFAVQQKLSEHAKGPRGPKTEKQPDLWDLTTDLFWCPHCNVRFYQTGAHGKGMQCKNGSLCPCQSAVNRKKAVRAVCDQLGELIQRDEDLIQQVICTAQQQDACDEDELLSQISSGKRKLSSITKKIDDLMDLAGQGDDADRNEIKSKIRSTQAQRNSVKHELSKLQKALHQSTSTITPDQVQEILTDFTKMLDNASSGNLGEEAVYKALALFRGLVGGRVWVHVEKRPNRKQTNVRGVFQPNLLAAVQKSVGQMSLDQESPAKEVSVWLREPPRVDRLATRVHELIDIQKLSHRETAKVLKKEGHKVNPGNVWYSYQRYYEVIGEPVPKRPYNNGNKRGAG